MKEKEQNIHEPSVPVTCIYHELYETKQEAMQAEYAFKQLTRKQKIHYMERASK